MPRVSATVMIEAPADAVWELVGDFGALGRWAGDAIARCVVDGSGPGAVRVVTDVRGMQIAEKLLHVDALERTLSYTFDGPAPVPIKDYVATMTVRSEGPDRSLVEWSGRFEPDGAPAEVGEEILRQVYATGLASLRDSV